MADRAKPAHSGPQLMTLHYHEKGEGFPLLLLHGNRQDSRFFRHQVTHLQPYFRTIAVDSRGHGLSPFGHAPLSLSLLADDILVLMDKLHLSVAFIAGFSDGANIALNLALKAPERFLGLALSSPNLHPSGMKPGFLIPLRLLYRFIRKFTFLPWFNKNAQLLRLMVEEPDIHPEALSHLHLPVLVMAGEHDFIRESHIRMIAASIPGAKLAIIQGGGHFHLKSRHRESNRILSDFFLGLAAL